MTPHEVANLINNELANFTTTILRAVDYDLNEDKERIVSDIKKITYDLEAKQIPQTQIYTERLTKTKQANQEANDALEQFDAEFNNSFSDVYEIYNINSEIQSISTDKSGPSFKKIFRKVTSLYKRIQNYFIDDKQIEKIQTESARLGKISTQYHKSLTQARIIIDNYEETMQGTYLAHHLAKNDPEYQNIIHSINSNNNILFGNKTTMKFIETVRNKLNGAQLEDFNKSMQEISNGIHSYEGTPDKGDTKNTVFRYVLNKALEFLSAQKVDSANIGNGLKHRFALGCEALNSSYIDLEQFGFDKRGILIDKIIQQKHYQPVQPTDIGITDTDNLHRTFDSNEIIGDLSDLTQEVNSAPIETSKKHIFKRCINSMTKFINKKAK